MSLALDQVEVLQDLHHFIADQGGFCDVVAFQNEDLEIAIKLRAAEYAGRALKKNASNGNVP